MIAVKGRKCSACATPILTSREGGFHQGKRLCATHLADAKKAWGEGHAKRVADRRAKYAEAHLRYLLEKAERKVRKSI